MTEIDTVPVWCPIVELPNTIVIALDGKPLLPFPGARASWRLGWQNRYILASWKDEALWVGGIRQEVLFEEHLPALSTDRERWQWLERGASRQLHPSVMDAMIESKILPLHFGIGPGGRILRLTACAVSFTARRKEAGPFLREWWVDNDRWVTGYYPLKEGLKDIVRSIDLWRM